MTVKMRAAARTTVYLLRSVLLTFTLVSGALASEWIEDGSSFDGEFEDPNHWSPAVVPGSSDTVPAWSAIFNANETYTVTVTDENAIGGATITGVPYGNMDISAGNVTLVFVPASSGVEPYLLFGSRADIWSSTTDTTQATFIDGAVLAKSLSVEARSPDSTAILNLDNSEWAAEWSVGVSGAPGGTTRMQALNGSLVQAGSRFGTDAGSMSIGGDGTWGEALIDASELIVRDPVASGGVVPIGTYEGRGALTVDNGSTLNIESSMEVGGFGGTGIFELRGGSDLDVGVDITVGNGEFNNVAGIGTATFSAEADDGVDVGDDLTVGRSGGNGTVTITQGSHISVGDRVSVGIGDGNDGTQGSLRVEAGSTLSSDGGTVGSHAGTGAVTVTGAGSTWDSRGGWLHIGIDPSERLSGIGTVEVELGGSLIGDKVVIAPQGTLSGDGGTIQSEVENNGTFSPGSSAGRMDIDGNLLFGSTAELITEIGGNLPGVEYDFLDVDGTVTLGGTLTVELIDDFELDYEPEVGDVFPFLAAAFGFSGDWDLVSLSTLSAGKAWVFDGPGTLRVVPVPAALPLLGFTLVVFGFLYRRRAA